MVQLAGMTPAEAIASATTGAARLMDLRTRSAASPPASPPT
jgi:imidazolonepropionase-like amidohydrolase